MSAIVNPGGGASVPLGAHDCYLQYVSASLVRLVRDGGKFLTINGVVREIPAAGVDLAPTGLTVGTAYWVAAGMSGSTMVLVANAGLIVVDAAGMAVLADNPACTLVGMVYVGGGPGFQVDNNVNGVTSYFNRKLKRIAPPPVTASTGSTAAVELHAGFRCRPLVWGDEIIEGGMTGYVYVNAGSTWILTFAVVDGVGQNSSSTYISYANQTTQNLISSYTKQGAGLALMNCTIHGNVNVNVGNWLGAHAISYRG